MHYPNPIFGQVKPGTDLAYFPAGAIFQEILLSRCAAIYHRAWKWCTGPIPWPTSRESACARAADSRAFASITVAAQSA